MTDLTGVTLLNRYYLRRQAGSGGMADVYEAWDSVRAARLAIKVLRRDLALNPHFFRMFTNEASLLRQLSHPNIVRLYEFEREGDLAFIVLDWVDGMNLAQAIDHKNRPFTLEEVSQILQPVCSALHYAHQSQVYHCDVKPPNILLQSTGQVLITDFGVARLANEETGGGTPPYMAPEQFNAWQVDARTDVYALGITLYEMLSGGYVPYRGDTPSSQGNTTRDRIQWEHQNLPLPPVQQFNPWLPDSIGILISTALHKDPNQRFATPIALRDAFEHARLEASRSGSQAATMTEWPTAQMQKPQPPMPVPQEAKSARPPGISGGPRPPRLAGAHLYGRAGEWAGQNIPISLNGLTMGRGSQNRLQIHDASVSRRHVTILSTRQGYVIRDEGSTLGTYINEQRITAPVRLRDGDVIRIGYQQVFEFCERSSER